MKLLTNEQQKSYENAKTYYICKERLDNKCPKAKKYRNVRDQCHYTGEYRGGVHSICISKYSVPKENSRIFHNGYNYDHYFIMKELAKNLRDNLNK